MITLFNDTGKLTIWPWNLVRIICKNTKWLVNSQLELSSLTFDRGAVILTVDHVYVNCQLLLIPAFCLSATFWPDINHFNKGPWLIFQVKGESFQPTMNKNIDIKCYSKYTFCHIHTQHRHCLQSQCMPMWDLWLCKISSRDFVLNFAKFGSLWVELKLQIETYYAKLCIILSL